MLNAPSPHSEWEFQNLHRRLELALDASQTGVWQHNLEKDELIWDVQMHRLYQTGKSVVTVMSASTWIEAVHHDDRQQAESDFQRAVASRDTYNSRYRIVLPDGSIRYMRSRAYFYIDEVHGPSFVGAEWDITPDIFLNKELAHQKSIAEARALALEKSNAQIEYAAEHDYLTGLPNRRFLEKHLTNLRNDNTIQTLSILHLDLERFKQINDSKGHEVGDQILQNVADWILKAIPDNSMVARVSGDEFVIVFSDFGDTDQLMQFAQDIQAEISAQIRQAYNIVHMRISVGAAWNQGSQNANLLLQSDLALYEAKKLGSGRIELFTPQLQAQLLEERTLANDLERAIAQREIEPYYQIQLDAKTFEIVGMEALARWRHPEKGILAPASFIKIAEKNGLMPEIDAAIFEQALRDKIAWEAKGLHVPRISINISAPRLSDPRLFDHLHSFHIPRDAFSFELIETIFLDDSDTKMMADINAIKDMGIDIEIDDFGSGHASLLGLIKLRPKRLKIDRQFVTDIISSRECRRIVGSIVEIAKALNVEVVAEGVETEDHAAILSELGCDILQGYAFSRPISSADIEPLLRNSRQYQKARLTSASNAVPF